MGIKGLDVLKGDDDDFIICPDCNGESNRDVNIKCGTCGCAGIIPKPPFTEEMRGHTDEYHSNGYTSWK